MILTLTIQWRPNCRRPKEKGKDKPITHVPRLCDWFSSSASACDSDNLVSLDCKRWSRKRPNQNAVLTRSLTPTLLITTPTPSPVKTSLYLTKLLLSVLMVVQKGNFLLFMTFNLAPCFALAGQCCLADLLLIVIIDNNILTLDIVGEAFLIFFFFAWSYSQFHSPKAEGGSGTPGTLPWLRHWITLPYVLCMEPSLKYLNE